MLDNELKMQNKKKIQKVIKIKKQIKLQVLITCNEKLSPHHAVIDTNTKKAKTLTKHNPKKVTDLKKV